VGIHEDLVELKKIILESQVKEKKFRYPFGKKVGKSQRIKNYVTVLVINENGTCYFKKYPIEDQTIMHDLIPRLATAGHVMHDKKGNPLIILPNWALEPFSPLVHYEKSMLNGDNSKGFKILMDKMISSKVDTKKKMAGWIKWVIGLIILAGIIFALVSGGGGKPS
jgi:hypothetical protein